MAKVVIVGATTAKAKIISIGAYIASVEVLGFDRGVEFEAMDYQNELSNVFELTNPDRDLEPCKSMDFDDRYTGKCKKLRREARGW